MKKRIIILILLLLAIPILNVSDNLSTNNKNTYDIISKYDYNNGNDI